MTERRWHTGRFLPAEPLDAPASLRRPHRGVSRRGPGRRSAFLRPARCGPRYPFGPRPEAGLRQARTGRQRHAEAGREECRAEGPGPDTRDLKIAGVEALDA